MFDSMQAGDRNTNSRNTNLGLQPSTQLLLIVQNEKIITNINPGQGALVGKKHTNR